VLSAKLSVLSSKLGLPTAAIERIAKKAADILQTEGAIVSAPGQPVAARMVVSHSGKRPHLVLPKKKSGGMSCDDDCPQYKSAKLCSHTVDAAESNKQLDQFIASYQGMKIPNLTKSQLKCQKGEGENEPRPLPRGGPLFLLKIDLNLT